MKKYKLLKMLLAFMLIFSYSSCDNIEEIDNSFTPRNIPFTLIGKSIMSGATSNISQQNTVVTNQTQWTNLLNQMNNSGAWSPFTTTNIDFTTDILIVVIDYERPHTGFTININSITENANNILVHVSAIGSENGYTVFSRPYHIIRVPIQTKPNIFQYT